MDGIIENVQYLIKDNFQFMFVYSPKIIDFIQRIKMAIKRVLIKEIGVKVHGERFYNESQSVSYPIKIVIFNDKAMLGYFNSEFFELGFHESLMHGSLQQLQNIIRHELAHYMTFIAHGNDLLPHGHEYKTYCLSKGWGEEVYRATCCLEGPVEISIEDSPILRKVKKLMALASSQNSHEAEQAMIKSQQILLKHNIETTFIQSTEEEKICLKRIMKQKKQDAKMNAIATILQTFFVSVVFSRSSESIYLEVVGERSNVEIAEYVAAFLDHELEKLWTQAKREFGLQGTIAKNSFFHGVARGYCDKVQALKRNYESVESRALMVIEKKLKDYQELIYSRLSRSKSSRQVCRDSSSHGERIGKKLTIRPGVESHTKKSQTSSIKSLTFNSLGKLFNAF